MLKKTAQKFRKGFTMIELLIVIAVLGVLTIAVVSAINPIEQINRSKDSGKISDSEQLIGAVDRFYTSRGYYPWQTGSADTDGIVQAWGPVDATWVDSAGSVEVLKTKLSTGGAAELKGAYVTRVYALNPKLYVSNPGTAGSSTYVCFNPQSQDFKEKAWNRCTETDEYGSLPDDFPAEACPADGCTGTTANLSTTCSYCLP